MCVCVSKKIPNEISECVKNMFSTAVPKPILRNNCFDFNSNIYKPISGFVIGTKVAPSYAYLVMIYSWKSRYMNTSN